MIDSSGRAIGPTTEASRVVFGSRINLVRLQPESTSMEVCDACGTVNMRTAELFCSCCSHELRAFYVASSIAKTMLQARVVPERMFPWSLAAFWLGMTSLTIMATLGTLA